MAEDITISVGLDSSGLETGAKRVERSLKNLRASANQAGTQGVDRLNQSIKKLSSITIANSQQLSKFTKNVRGVGNAGKKTAKELSGFQKTILALQKSTRVIDGPLGGIAARFETIGSVARGADKSVIAFVASVAAFAIVGTSIVKASVAFVNLQNRLRLVTTDVENLNEVQSKLLDISLKTRVSQEATVDVYTRLARGTDTLGISQARLLKVTETVNNAVKVSGSTAQSAAAALFQFGQGLAANALRGQELNSVMEQIPALARAIADGLGLTLGELRAFSKEGKLTGEVVVAALEKSGKSLDELAAKIDGTLSSAFVRLKDQFVDSVGRFGESTGVIKGLVNVVDGLTASLDTLITTMTIAGKLAIAFFGGRLLQGAFAIKGLTVGLTALAGSVGVLGKSASILAVIMGGLKVAMTALLLVAKRLWAVLLANPLGLVAAAYIAVTEVASRFTAEIERQNKVINDSLKAQRDVGIGYQLLTARSAERVTALIEENNLTSANALLNAKAARDQALADRALQLQQATSDEQRTKIRKNFRGLLDVSAERIGQLQTQVTLTKKLEGAEKQINDVVDRNKTSQEKLNEQLEEAIGLKTDLLRLDSLSATQSKQLEQIMIAEGRLRQELLDAEEKQLEKLEKAQLKVFKESDLFKQSDKLYKGLTSATKTFFKTFIKDGKATFDSFKDLFSDMLADLATLAIQKKILIPLITSAGGALGLGGSELSAITGQKGGSVDASGGLLGTAFKAGSSFLGNLSGFQFGLGGTGGIPTGGFAGATGIPFAGDAAAGSVSTSAASGFGGAVSGLAGGLAGNFGANAIFGGDRGVGADIGGTLGGIAGQALIPIPVLGAAIGSFLGNAIGGLFGGGVGTIASEFGGTTNSNGLDFDTGSKGTGTEFAQGLGDTISTAILGLGSLAGVDLGGLNVRGGVNTKQFGGGFFQFGKEGGDLQTLRFDEEDEDAASNALGKLAVELLKVSDVTNGSVLTALENIQTEGRAVDDILGDISFAAAFDALDFIPPVVTQLEAAMDALNAQFEAATEKAKELGLAEEKVIQARDKAVDKIRTDFNKSVKGQILSLVDPTSASLKQLNASFVEIRRNAIEVGGDLVEVERLFGLQRKEILEGSSRDIVATFTQALVDIQKFRDSLDLNTELGGLSSLGRANAAQGQFDRLQARINAGDESAFSELEQVSNDYLNASLDYFGQTAPYLQNLQAVKDLLSTAEGIATDTITVEQRALDESVTQTGLLEKLVDRGTTTSEAIQKISEVSTSQILREGETLSDLEGRSDGITGLPLDLARKLKVAASGGEFDFSSSSGSFADFVKGGNSGSGDLLIQLLQALGGNNIGGQAARFFANGTGSSKVPAGMAVVGERGAELVNFGSPVQVLSNGTSASMMGGGDATASEVNAYRRQSSEETVAIINAIDGLNSQLEDVKDEISGMRAREG